MKELADYLSTFLTDERKAKMERILKERTRYLTLVLEDIFQPHNASAVLRTADALGIQDVHIVEKNNTYKVNPDVALGSAQWLSLKTWRGEQGLGDCYRSLKARGYRVVATTPHTRARSLDELALEDGKIALVFGTELTGLSPEALQEADEYVYIPMHGFVESFNISVTAALCMHHLGHKLRSGSLDWRLSAGDYDEIWLSWLRASIKSAPALERRFQEAKEQESLQSGPGGTILKP